MFCVECGRSIPEGVRFCNGCGRQVNGPSAASPGIGAAAMPIAAPITKQLTDEVRARSRDA